MPDSIILSKVESVERCLDRIGEDYLGFETLFREEQMRQDAIVLNLQRACELTIDLANHLVKIEKLGVPKSSRDSFEILEKENIINVALTDALSKMVAFRNIAVHQYRDLDLGLTEEILNKHLGVFLEFTAIALSRRSC